MRMTKPKLDKAQEKRLKKSALWITINHLSSDLQTVLKEEVIDVLADELAREYKRGYRKGQKDAEKYQGA